MTISKRLSRANRIATTEDNKVIATLISIEQVASDYPDENGEVSENDQLEWIWEVPTAIKGKNTEIHEWTGLSINSEESAYSKTEEKLVHNKLTQILSNCGFFTIDEIDEIDLEELDIESLIGQKFEFELERRNKNKIWKSPKLSTMRLVD